MSRTSLLQSLCTRRRTSHRRGDIVPTVSVSSPAALWAVTSSLDNRYTTHVCPAMAGWPQGSTGSSQLVVIVARTWFIVARLACLICPGTVPASRGPAGLLDQATRRPLCLSTSGPPVLLSVSCKIRHSLREPRIVTMIRYLSGRADGSPWVLLDATQPAKGTLPSHPASQSGIAVYSGNAAITWY